MNAQIFMVGLNVKINLMQSLPIQVGTAIIAIKMTTIVTFIYSVYFSPQHATQQYLNKLKKWLCTDTKYAWYQMNTTIQKERIRNRILGFLIKKYKMHLYCPYFSLLMLDFSQQFASLKKKLDSVQAWPLASVRVTQNENHL